MMTTSVASSAWTRGTSGSRPGVCRCLCVRHSLKLCALMLAVIVLVQATPHFSPEDVLELDTFDIPDKRPARLSYFRAPASRFRGRYESNPYGRRSYGAGYGQNVWRKKAVNRYQMPWDSLPDRNCIRKYCRSNNDCCRRFSKCNVQAHVCYDCWYGFPCSSSRDCCHRYPYCDPVRKTCAK